MKGWNVWDYTQEICRSFVQKEWTSHSEGARSSLQSGLTPIRLTRMSFARQLCALTVQQDPPFPGRRKRIAQIYNMEGKK